MAVFSCFVLNLMFALRVQGGRDAISLDGEQVIVDTTECYFLELQSETLLAAPNTPLE